MRNSVSVPPFDSHAVAGNTDGALDAFDYVDALPGLIPHLRPQRVPLGAPLVVGGWAVEPGGAPPQALVVVLDSARVHTALTGISRGDVALGRPGTPERVGFRAVIPTGDLAAGGHEVRAYALDAGGAWHEAGYRPFWLTPNPLAELTVTPRRLRMRIDQVVDLAPDGALLGFDAPIPLGRFVLLTGSAVDSATRRGAAGVLADDARGQRWSAPCDVARPDLRGPLDALDDRLGFEIVIPSDALGRGRHRLSVRGYDASGRLFEGGIEVTVDIAGPTRPFPPYPRRHRAPARAAAELVALDDGGTPMPGRRTGAGYVTELKRGTIALVEGWALTPAAGGAGSVFVELAPPEPGIPPHRFPALAGFRRDRAPDGLPPAPAPDGWFSARIDTAHLPPRHYVASLAVVDDDRRAYARFELGSVTVAAASGGAAGAGRRT